MRHRRALGLAATAALAGGILSACTFSGTAVCTQTQDTGVVTCTATPNASPSTAPTTPAASATATPTPSASATTTAPQPSSTPTTTPSPTVPATPSATATPTQTVPPTGTLPQGASLKQIDGGPDYNAKFSPGLPTDPGFFPIGVWYESADREDLVAYDKATGLNTYVAMTANPDTAAMRKYGMYLMPWSDQSVPGKGTETVAYTLEDEPDMMDPGWWGAPSSKQWAYMDAKLNNRIKDGRANYTNYGLGILANEDRDPDASRFVQKYSDYISADCYMWYGGGLNYESSRCIGKGDQRLTLDQQHRARNYGIIVERMRGFAANTKPVWSFIEIADITPGQLRAAMWHSIISGARGIIFFNHQFGKTCETQHALRESCYKPQREMVQAVTAQIRELAKVINAPDVVGLTTNTQGVTSTTKWNDGKPVIFAGNNDNASKSATFTVTGQGNGTVTVLGENRTLQMTGGKFTDQFANGDAVHIYRIG